jgi:hypothetical protein
MIYLFESLEAECHGLLPIHVGFVEHPTSRSKKRYAVPVHGKPILSSAAFAHAELRVQYSG